MAEKFKFNYFTLCGNLAKDAELKTFGERQCLQICVAVNYKKTDEPDYFYVNKWGQEVHKFLGSLKKGTRVIVEGYMKRYKDKEGRYNISLEAFEIEVQEYKTGSRYQPNQNYRNVPSEASQYPKNKFTKQPKQNDDLISEEDIPF